MADGKLNFRISTSADASGFKEFDSRLRTSARGMKDFGQAGSRIVGELGAQFKGPLTEAAGGAFNILQSLARGGIWGALAAGVTGVVGKWVEWRKEIEKQREERRKLLKDMAAGHERRIAQYAEDAAKREAAAYEARVKAMKEWADAQTKMVDSVTKNNAALASADARIRAAQRRQDIANGERDELIAGNAGRMEDAQDAVEAARQAVWAIMRKMDAGSATAGELQIAEKNLAATTAELAAVEAENAKRLRDKQTQEEIDAGIAIAKQEAAFRAEQLREEEKKRREQLSVIDRAIAAQKKLADAWEKDAQKARGKDFAVWLGETEAEEKAVADERKRFAQANAGAARRAQNIRDRGFWASARDKSWLARYEQWSAAQDPANNSAAKEAEKLEKDRAEKVAEIASVVKSLAEAIRDANTQG